MTESDSSSPGDVMPSNPDGGSKLKTSKSLYEIKFAIVAILMVSLFPLLSSYASTFELFSHFRLQILIAAALVTVLLVIYKCWIYLIPAVVAIILNGAAIYPLYFGTQERAQVPNFRLLTMNLSVSNRDFLAVEKCIRESNADVICVQELSPEMNDRLARDLKDYPYRLVDPRTDPFGIGIYSRHYVNSDVIIPSESPTLSDAQSSRKQETINQVMVGITIGGADIKIISTHPPPPLRQDFYEWRNKQLEFIVNMAAKSKEPMIIAGDLNCTAYSPIFSRLLEQGNLHDSELGFGIQPTWPNGMVPLMIPIDHVLYKGQIRIVNRRLGLAINSDHTPVVVSFKIGE